MQILDYRLEETCGACPEQYDVYLGDDRVGYLRLRYGYFSAEANGIQVYSAHTIGDGIFAENERMYHLVKAIDAINVALKQKSS